MTHSVYQLRRRWFFDDFPVIISSSNYARCINESCPFRVVLRKISQAPPAYTFVRFVFEQHCHALSTERPFTKDIVQAKIDLINAGLDEDQLLDTKHKQWQQQALEQGQKLKEQLLVEETAVTYAVEHPMLSGRAVEIECGFKMSREAIGMAKKRKMEDDDDFTLENIIANKKHHLLKNEGEKILIFGDDKAVERLAVTNVIHADGTFTCILPHYSQLYIFHATVENNVSLPVLFCLVKGKDQETYVTLLGLVEELANDDGRTIFNREVTFMCDFELSMINAVKLLYGLVRVKCCFFHFVQSIRRKATDVINAVEGAAGQNAEKAILARNAVRRLMMLPLVPEELITPELVNLIIAASTDGRSAVPRELKALQMYVLTTYVGKRRARSGPVLPPSFPPALWCVSGMASRTNNAAESVHAHMNQKVSGKLDVLNFIRILEMQMKQTNDRIRAGSEPETKAVEGTKNRLLAIELKMLLSSQQGILGFLDNCGSVVGMKRDADAKAFVRQTIAPVEDIDWKRDKRVLVEDAAHGLYHRLHPGGQMAEGDVLGSVTQWAFQVPRIRWFESVRVKSDSHLSNKGRGKASLKPESELKENGAVSQTRTESG